MLVGVASVAGAAGMVALGSTAVVGGGCICPKVYAPVTCSNGKTYTNLCAANCNHATGCASVPWYLRLPPRAAERSVVDEQ
jgi:hypothetical protein